MSWFRSWIVFGVMLSMSAGAAQADKFHAELSGDNEVPPVMTDTTGQGEVLFEGNRATIRLRVNDGVTIQQAHIHCAPAGVNGPVVAFLAGAQPAGLFTTIRIRWAGAKRKS